MRERIAVGVVALFGTGALALGACSPSTVATPTAVGSTIIGGAAVTTTPMSAEELARLQASADAAIAGANGQVPGIWVGIWHPERGWGIVASGEATLGSIAATPADHLRIGSVTKTFTATEVLKLVDAGQVKLTDTLETLLPQTVAKYPVLAPVTLADLLGMTSGIPDYTEVPGMMKTAYEQPQKVWSADELVATALTGVTSLGSEDKYSNTNYILLGQILQAQTGQTVQDLINADLAAIGMTNSALPLPGDNVMPKPSTDGYNFDAGVAALQAVGVDATSGTITRDAVTSWGQAAGGMYSTVADLGLWAGTGLGTNQLSAALGQQRLTAHDINSGAVKYGLGIENWGDGWIGHGGQAIGWESTVAYNIQTGAVIVIVVNETGSAMLGARVVQEYFPEDVARFYL